MLTIYRRHRRECEHRSEGRKYRRCRCPIWVDGVLSGREIRKSLGLANWEKAQGIVREWETEGAQGSDDGKEQAPSVEEACADFLADAGARNLQEATLYKYRLLFKHLQAFAAQRGLRNLHEFDVPALRKFRTGWKDSPIAAVKKLERLRAFFRYCQQAGWIADNPAVQLQNPRVPDKATLPFTRDEVAKILAACNEYPNGYGKTGQENAVRLRALVLLLRYSGLRIGDAVSLPRERVTDGRLFLYTAKSGAPVYAPLPEFVVAALDAAPCMNPEFFFWTGKSLKKSAVGDWQRSLRKLFALAGIQGGHAHRFRDTFAVELLLQGVPLERVSVLLGHRSVKVTERHYAPWVRARQEQLEADVRKTWKDDPILLSETKGTPEVHGKKTLVN